MPDTSDGAGSGRLLDKTMTLELAAVKSVALRPLSAKDTKNVPFADDVVLI